MSLSFAVLLLRNTNCGLFTLFPEFSNLITGLASVDDFMCNSSSGLVSLC